MRCSVGASASEPAGSPGVLGGEERLPNMNPPSSGRLYLTNCEMASCVRRAPANAVTATPLPMPSRTTRTTVVCHLPRSSARERVQMSPTFPTAEPLPVSRVDQFAHIPGGFARVVPTRLWVVATPPRA